MRTKKIPIVCTKCGEELLKHVYWSHIKGKKISVYCPYCGKWCDVKRGAK